ncbi:hypothetical protein DFH11DRAFT_1593582, partial [Phellopilus nigrolimitatus]
MGHRRSQIRSRCRRRSVITSRARLRWTRRRGPTPHSYYRCLSRYLFAFRLRALTAYLFPPKRLQHAFFKLSEPLRTLTPLIKAARELAKSK